MFTDVGSIDDQGDADNDIRAGVIAAENSYIINTISWTGSATAQEDPGTPGTFPTWGNELSLRVTHDQSGHFADFQLGQDNFFFANQLTRTFTGNQYSLYGTRVQPGDGLTFEFWEQPNGAGDSDIPNLPDAIWEDITLDIGAIADPDPMPALEVNTIRVDASGRDSWPSNVTLTGGPDGDINYSDFWGIEYAAGSDGPSITQIDIRLSTDGGLYFNFDQFFGQPILDAATTGIDGGVGIDFPEPGPQLSDSSTVATLTFDAGDFTAGDLIRFGIDIDAIGIAQDDLEGFVDLNNNLLGGEIPGSALAELSDDVSVTITFDDDSTVSGSLTDLGMGAEDVGREVVTLFTDLALPSAQRSPLEADFESGRRCRWGRFLGLASESRCGQCNSRDGRRGPRLRRGRRRLPGLATTVWFARGGR